MMQWVQTKRPYYNSFCPLTVKGENVYAADTVEGLGKVFPRAGICLSLTINDSNFFAGTTSGIRLSTDYGVNWNASNNGLSAFTYVRTIVVSNMD